VKVQAEERTNLNPCAQALLASLLKTKLKKAYLGAGLFAPCFLRVEE